jgi:hypothetical protein
MPPPRLPLPPPSSSSPLSLFGLNPFSTFMSPIRSIFGFGGSDPPLPYQQQQPPPPRRRYSSSLIPHLPPPGNFPSFQPSRSFVEERADLVEYDEEEEAAALVNDESDEVIERGQQTRQRKKRRRRRKKKKTGRPQNSREELMFDEFGGPLGLCQVTVIHLMGHFESIRVIVRLYMGHCRSIWGTSQGEHMGHCRSTWDTSW